MAYNYSFENSFDQTMSSSQSAVARNGNLSRNGYYEDVDELNAVVSRQQMQSQKVSNRYFIERFFILFSNLLR